jgi:hypothetical protein
MLEGVFSQLYRRNSDRPNDVAAIAEAVVVGHWDFCVVEHKILRRLDPKGTE